MLHATGCKNEKETHTAKPYEEFYPLAYNAVQFGESQTMFLSNISPP
jgi:hypothetical protein